MSKKPTAIDVLIGRRIRERRTVLEIRQEQLAERLGISFQQFQKYETGENRITASRLFELATELRVDISWFFELAVKGEVQKLVPEGDGASRQHIGSETRVNRPRELPPFRARKSSTEQEH